MKRALFFLWMMGMGMIHASAQRCATCGGFGAGGSSPDDVGPNLTISLGTAQYGQSAGTLNFSSSLPDASLFTPVPLQFDASARTDVNVVTANSFTTNLVTAIETDAVLVTN